ncbi:MAG: Mov34/MPN/PAD-1 family protein [Brevundimonas sp.]|uniref:Mov34/MPN/PAD-1 family protein n=1 Tax=Brevundimonas sp. TaxID=1871086 RepID=UPI002716B366|nr:Mov34/MPN/PAD-1 family protein [Brevundimonas sp.]MDO9077976.1 Mov34/MPN/PAD-1 family protein [Brevundimonas sp.]MDZ4062791.1 Mov34/MPN/PAD-1 family protein [Brevundimonas sp.]
MLKLQIHPDVVDKLVRELRRAGRREIGGVLVGEHIGRNTFRIVDLSIQRHGGERACFVREPQHHKRFLDAFYARTGDDYRRFNYLGEWHSHPSFTTDPSSTDVRQMTRIVTDDPEARSFAVLVIVRLGEADILQIDGFGFRADHQPDVAEIEQCPRPDGDPRAEAPDWWARVFGPPRVKPVVRFI